MNKKKYIIIAAIILCVAAAIWGLHLNQDKVIYGLSEGTYEVEGATDAIVPASITFDLDENTFSFNYDLLSSYLPRGTWRMKNGKITATTDDKKHVYIFNVVDNDTLEFVQKGSSEITYIEDKINPNPPIVDGTKFIFSDPR